MTSKDILKKNDHVITNKGNHGRIVSIGIDTAMVKIGYKISEIEIQNLTNINHGTLLEVEYMDLDVPIKTPIFIKHGTIVYNQIHGYMLYKEVQQLVKQKQQLEFLPLITKIIIP